MKITKQNGDIIECTAEEYKQLNSGSEKKKVVPEKIKFEEYVPKKRYHKSKRHTRKEYKVLLKFVKEHAHMKMREMVNISIYTLDQIGGVATFLGGLKKLRKKKLRGYNALNPAAKEKVKRKGSERMKWIQAKVKVYKLAYGWTRKRALKEAFKAWGLQR